MKSFNQFISEKKKTKVTFNPMDSTDPSVTMNEEELDEFFDNPSTSSSLNSKHERLSNKIDNDKSHNFVSRAIAQGKLNDRMAAQHAVAKKRNHANGLISKVKGFANKVKSVAKKSTQSTLIKPNQSNTMKPNRPNQ